MLCYGICYVVSYVMIRYTSCFAILFNFMLHYTVCYIMLGYMLCYARLYVMLCYVIFYVVLSYFYSMLSARQVILLCYLMLCHVKINNMCLWHA